MSRAYGTRTCRATYHGGFGAQSVGERRQLLCVVNVTVVTHVCHTRSVRHNAKLRLAPPVCTAPRTGDVLVACPNVGAEPKLLSRSNLGHAGGRGRPLEALEHSAAAVGRYSEHDVATVGGCQPTCGLRTRGDKITTLLVQQQCQHSRRNAGHSPGLTVTTPRRAASMPALTSSAGRAGVSMPTNRTGPHRRCTASSNAICTSADTAARTVSWHMPSAC